MPELRAAACLAEYQAYVAELERERGFSGQTTIEKCLLLGEEVGELFKAVRKVEGVAVDETARIGPVSDELADILIYLCAIANRYHLDLEQAFLAKEAINKTRRWTS